MQNDVLVAFIIYQAVFFFLELYIFSKITRDIARKGENIPENGVCRFSQRFQS